MELLLVFKHFQVYIILVKQLVVRILRASVSHCFIDKEPEAQRI